MRTLLLDYGERHEQERQFKRQCQAELNKFDEEIELYRQLGTNGALRVSFQCTNTLFLDASSTANEALQAEKAQLAKLRLELAAVNQQCARMQRTIDSQPMPAELTQYQRRFIELYDQSAFS